ncbi:MAG: cobalamin biosynthesis protein [Chloroflexi bacterium]|nr:cobalamin biosynthesis protein [Chloroflexota bacterium]
MLDAKILLLAVALDILLGEMPTDFHPVVGMGKALSFGMRFAPSNDRLIQFIYGAFVVIIVLGTFAASAFALLWFTRAMNTWVYVLVAAVMLKSCFSLRALARAANAVRVHVVKQDLASGRKALHALVSRDTAELDGTQIIGAAVESVAENTCDSFVAPIFFFLLFGVPGAMAYRVANTADAMFGYHGATEFLGKFPARLDDALNYIPARVTGMLLVCSSFISRNHGRQAWRMMWRDHARTESPNAGWPMSAVAGSLGVRLEKKGLYRLGDDNYTLTPQAIDKSVQLMALTALLWLASGLAIKGGVLAAIA